MTLEITTPAVLFSTVSLLMNAYLGRFSNIAKLMRNLAAEVDQSDLDQSYINQQVAIFSKRMIYIKYLQFCGVLSLFFSTGSMFLLLIEKLKLANICFIIALVFFLITIIIVVFDIYNSMNALSIELDR
ncbi:MAG: DUF2721 domain-containing protein [Bacillota bacterium]